MVVLLVFVFRLDRSSGVPAYVQLIAQAKRALRLGELSPGDQLPTARQVVADVGINPNTVWKAYRELEAAGLVETRSGLGTFVKTSLENPALRAAAGIQEKLRDLVVDGLGLGLSPADFVAMLDAALEEAQLSYSAVHTEKGSAENE